MTTGLLPGTLVSCPDRNPRPRNQAMYKAACDAAAADPNERRAVREFDACGLFTEMVVWYEGEFRLVKQVERPYTQNITIHFVMPKGSSMFWFTKRSEPVYCLVDLLLMPC